MTIAEITKPETWLEGLDDQTKFDVDGLLYCLEDGLKEAAVALALFKEQEIKRPSTPFFGAMAARSARQAGGRS